MVYFSRKVICNVCLLLAFIGIQIPWYLGAERKEKSAKACIIFEVRKDNWGFP